MMLMIPKGYDKAAPGAMPDAKDVAAMMKVSRRRYGKIVEPGDRACRPVVWATD